MSEWRDLADSELRAKLEQRGLSANTALLLARTRDDETVSECLDFLFEVGR